MSDTVFIYALSCPVTGRTRYVGKSKDPIVRYKRHISNANFKTHPCAKWVKRLATNGHVPVLEILDEVSIREWKALEGAYIYFFRSQKIRLLNVSSAGGGVIKHTKRSKEKMSRALSGRKISLEWRKKMSEAHTGKKLSQEHCRAIRSSRIRNRFKNFKGTSTNPFRGVSLIHRAYKGKRYSYWCAFLSVNGKSEYLGTFPTPESASEAYKAAAKTKKKEYEKKA